MAGQSRRTPRLVNRTPRALQPSEDVQMPEVQDDVVQQRLQWLTASQRQNAESLTQLNSRIDQLGHEFRQTMIESALTIQSVMQETCGLGQGMEQINHVLHNVVMDKVEGIDFRFQKADEVMRYLVAENDKRTQNINTSICKVID